jgi:beta-fructofuranosidase
MYSAYGFRSAEIGDVDVLWHDGLFHLFHLVLPNHDYIAHAVSDDGLQWRRVANALFISDPGGWDDDMLWTMHVSPDPHHPGWWRMFYTGLTASERGLIQRVGLARSDDLYHWEKDTGEQWPLEIPGDHYEYSVDEGRNWVSFRDPFYIRHAGRGFLLAAARSNEGPVIRRGCVSLAEETDPDVFEFREPLFHPRRYDDVEVPSLFEDQGRFYLLGSIREDVKVHYWMADRLEGPYRNPPDNVLLPQGNYAARICVDPDGRILVWNYFFRGPRGRGEHLLPPPKEVRIADDGELRLASFSGFDDKVAETLEPSEGPTDALMGTADATCEKSETGWRLSSSSGFEVFAMPGRYRDLRMSGVLEVLRPGKLGLVLHLSEEGDGYFVSVDLPKGVVQIRFWAENPAGDFQSAFEYEQMQASHFVPREGPVPFVLMSYGTYIELSLYDQVILTLADQRFEEGRTGLYVESCDLEVRDLVLEKLTSPIPLEGSQNPASRGAAKAGT